MVLTTTAGCSYFGVRIPRHVRRDMADLAARGYTGVLHTYSENDLEYYRGTMREIVEASHAVGLTVQVSPWGLGRTFGGEAESRFVTFHPEECQVLDDGRRVAGACLNSPCTARSARSGPTPCSTTASTSVFWDEPAWMVPGTSASTTRAGGAASASTAPSASAVPCPAELTPEVQAFREASVVDFLREMLAHVAARGGQNTVCLLPATEGTHGISDWNLVAELPGLDDVRDRSVLEALERVRRSVRAALRQAAARDLRPARRERRSSGCRASA